MFLFSIRLNTVDRDLNQYKIVVPLFGAASCTKQRHNNLVLISPFSQFRISEVEF